MNKRDSTPATRGDIDGLARRLDGHDSRFVGIDARFDAVDARFDAVDARFDAVDARFDAVDARFGEVDARFDAADARFEKLDKKVDAVHRTLAFEFVKVRAEMAAVEARTVDAMRRLEERVVSVLDRAVGRMETLWQESVLLPKTLDRHGKALGDHERRIAALESRPTR